MWTQTEQSINDIIKKKSKRGGGNLINPRNQTLTVECMGPTGGLVLGEGDESVPVLVVELQIPLRSMHNLALRLGEVPLGELLRGDGPVRGRHVDLGEELLDAARHVEAILVVDVVLGVHELLPLGLRLHSRRRISLSTAAAAMAEVVVRALPLPILAAALDVGDERIEGDLVPSSSSSAVAAGGEGGAELEAAVWAEVVMGGGEGEEEDDEKS